MTANASWSDPVFGGEVVGGVAVAIVDGDLRDELLDVDGVAALDRYVGEFVVLDLHILVLADGVAFDLLFGRHFLLGDGVHHLALEAIARGAVEGVEADLFGGRRGGIDGSHAGLSWQARCHLARAGPSLSAIRSDSSMRRWPTRIACACIRRKAAASRVRCD